MNSQTLQFSLFYIMMLQQRENKNKMCPLQGFKCNWETKFCMEESRWRRRLTLQVSSTAHSGLSTEADTRADFSKAYSSRLLLLLQTTERCRDSSDFLVSKPEVSPSFKNPSDGVLLHWITAAACCLLAMNSPVGEELVSYLLEHISQTGLAKWELSKSHLKTIRG